MRRDYETTDLTGAAEFERLNTPAYDERADRYEPDGYVHTSWPIEELIARFGPIMSCTHPTCRTSLTDDTAVYCDHGNPFCGDCVFEEGCRLCGDEAVASDAPCDFPGCDQPGMLLVANDAPLTSPEYAERYICRWHQRNAAFGDGVA